MTVIPALTPDQLSLLADAFRLLGDPTRLRIVMHCMDGPRSVGAIACELGLSQPLVSHHLRLLRTARLLRAVRQARHVFYTVSDHHISHMIADLAAHMAEKTTDQDAAQHP
ncbi:transcriptional regulator, ArsR family [Loktanella fryxellensis]|uniref:Transcriptional regulator, ArsR family n=1 Tax=Loktanella fryxellensis TaxID=245187 RepID=A0A1H8A5X4_9RHOB|nr:metalloregulator ArsR/SmtB family transcription factor [Loktanella fryxellensis]SEM66302.1 transcriptional regulator, ArsR family [Loktanella fryxellensis]